jgi:hypothetical protein
VRHNAAESGSQRRTANRVLGENRDFSVQRVAQIGMGRKIVKQDIPQQVCKMTLKLRVFGFGSRAGRFCDQYQKITKGVLKNRVFPT